MENEYKYDVALSFAGEDRDYVEDVATYLQGWGIKVFYDKFLEDDLWGKNLYDHLQDIYKNKARYSILFISEHYKRKNWTNHERQSAQARAFKESQEYILPVRFDDTEIPGLQSTVGYLSALQYTPIDIAKIFLKKIGFEYNKRWWGYWERENPILSNNGYLFIKEVMDKGFIFDLTVQNGSHLGNLENEYAEFTTPNEALFSYKDNDMDEASQIHFFKIKDQIQLTTKNCQIFCGARAYFSGDYTFQKDALIFFDDIIDDEILSKLYFLINNGENLFITHIKSNWKNFLKCFCTDSTSDNLDDFNAKIITTYVPGFMKDYAAILMINDNKEIFGAYFDTPNMYYFSSLQQYKQNIPKTISQWITQFDHYELHYLK
jgi:hypothetical protein